MISVIIPWRDPGDPDRAAAFEWVHPRLVAKYPQVVVSSDRRSDVWSKTQALLWGRKEVTGDIIIQHDADCWAPGLDEAVAAVEAGMPWAFPHSRMVRLTAEATADVLAGEEPHDGMEAYRDYPSVIGAGIIVLRTDVFDSVPPDHRFLGSGGEDEAWATALTTLYGPPYQVEGPCYFLWHEPVPREVRSRKGTKSGNYIASELVDRYREAAKNPSAMKRLVRSIGGKI